MFDQDQPSQVDSKLETKRKGIGRFNALGWVLLFLVAVAGILWVLPPLVLNSRSSHAQEPQKVDVASLEQAVRGGDERAILKLARFYAGSGMRRDLDKAASLYRQAMDRGNAEAMAGLGELYQSGRLGSNGLTMAVEFYRKAAESGNMTGQYNLGYCYERGQGVEHNEKEATKWYRLAAEGGDATAQYDVAQRYALGLGTETDLVEAYKWYVLASKQGQPDARTKLSALKSKLDSQQTKEANSRVAEFRARNP